MLAPAGNALVVNWYVYIFQLTIKNEVDQKVYDFDAAIWVRVDTYQDFWKELPVKKPDQLEGTRLGTINYIYYSSIFVELST